MTTIQVAQETQEYEWRLGQRVFKVVRTVRPITTLQFDPRNQRIQHALRAEQIVGDGQVSGAM